MNPSELKAAMYAISRGKPWVFSLYPIGTEDENGILRMKYELAKIRAEIKAAVAEEAPVPDFVTKQSPEQLRLSLASVGIKKDVTEANLVGSQREYIEKIAWLINHEADDGPDTDGE